MVRVCEDWYLCKRTIQIIHDNSSTQAHYQKGPSNILTKFPYVVRNTTMRILLKGKSIYSGIYENAIVSLFDAVCGKQRKSNPVQTVVNVSVFNLKHCDPVLFWHTYSQAFYLTRWRLWRIYNSAVRAMNCSVNDYLSSIWVKLLPEPMLMGTNSGVVE